MFSLQLGQIQEENTRKKHQNSTQKHLSSPFLLKLKTALQIDVCDIVIEVSFSFIGGVSCERPSVCYMEKVVLMIR